MCTCSCIYNKKLADFYLLLPVNMVVILYAWASVVWIESCRLRVPSSTTTCELRCGYFGRRQQPLASTCAPTSTSASSTINVCQRLIADLLNVSRSTQLHLASPAISKTTTTSTRRPSRLHAQAKFYLQLKIYFTASISFVDLLYMLCLLFRSLPLDMLGGLAMPTRRLPDLRVQLFQSCAMPPSTCSGACPCQSKGRQTCGVLPSPLSCH
jgi:hypothetical protein